MCRRHAAMAIRLGAGLVLGVIVAACSPDGDSAPAPEPTAPAPSPPPLASGAGIPITGDDMLIEGDVRIAPGTYSVSDTNGDGVLHVRGDGTTLDLTGVTLVGFPGDAPPDADTYRGVGVAIDGARGVSVTGGQIRGFKVGVAVQGSDAAVLEDIDVSANFRQRLLSTVARGSGRARTAPESR